jgi:hypothetical protein
LRESRKNQGGQDTLKEKMLIPNWQCVSYELSSSRVFGTRQHLATSIRTLFMWIWICWFGLALTVVEYE